MVISKNKFFLLLVAIFIFPFYLYKIIWLINSKPAMAEMRFLGRTLEVQGSSDHPVFRFSSNGHDTVFFNGNFVLDFKPGDIVPIRYQRNNPADAKVNSFTCMWMDIIFYTIPQWFILLIVFFTPERWDPVIPNKSQIAFAKRPFIRIMKADDYF